VKEHVIEVGDVVYCTDNYLKKYCPELIDKPAIVWSIYQNQARLRFIDFEYVNPLSYHGADIFTCVKVPSVIEMLLCE